MQISLKEITGFDCTKYLIEKIDATNCFDWNRGSCNSKHVTIRTEEFARNASIEILLFLTWIFQSVENDGATVPS